MKSLISAIAISCVFSASVDAQGLGEGDIFEVGIPFSAAPINFNIAQIENIQFQAVATGIGMAQTNPASGDFNSLVDIANAQLIVQKNTGLVQFYIQGGYYSTPSLGTTYQRASQQTMDSFGLVPLANISFAPTSQWLLTAGKINSFGGNENTFTYQNNNIDRGLLWNQTSNVSRGFQASYTQDAFSSSVTLNDGFYSNQLSWMGASAKYQLDDQSSTSFVWVGSIKPNTSDTFITPIAQNNSQIFNLIYSYASSRWTISPYLQYTYVPANASLGILSGSQTTGAAILTNYRFSNAQSDVFSLPLRFEYIGSGGKGNPNAPNLLYGQGSAAWSATITPTYQYERVFIRAELSYVQALNTAQGKAFGPSGNANNQTRLMFETGLLY
jgi:hypothetical protein